MQQSTSLVEQLLDLPEIKARNRHIIAVCSVDIGTMQITHLNQILNSTLICFAEHCKKVTCHNQYSLTVFLPSMHATVAHNEGHACIRTMTTETIYMYSTERSLFVITSKTDKKILSNEVLFNVTLFLYPLAAAMNEANN